MADPESVSTRALLAELATLRTALADARKRAEDAESSNARFRLVARATNDILYDWDVRTGAILWNDAVRTVLRFEGDPSNAGISWWATRIHPEDSERVSASLDAAMTGHNEAWTDTYRFSTADGAWLEIIDRGLFMRDGNGQCVRMIGAMMDVTNRKQLQTRLVLADRLAAVGTMAAGVAHELNNPLTWVLANVRLVEDGAGQLLDAQAQRALANAAKGAERMRAIINDLRIFSRAEGSLTPVDVRATLNSALSIVATDLRQRAELEVDDTTAGPVFVLTTESRLAQVLLNLLINAVQAMPPGNADRNRIQVRLRTVDANVHVQIDDSGVGIPAHLRPQIFDPFFTTKPPGEGTGLGLAITQQLLQQMGGSIRLVPRPGRGTCFSIQMPLTAPKRQRVPTPHRTSEPVARHRVLAIDDEPMIVELLEQLLASHFDVVGEVDARAALLRLGSERFDAVLCDVMMPALTGLDLHDQLRRAGNPAADRLIFLTGGATTQAVANAIEASGRPCLQKPFELATLRSQVQRVAGR